MRGFWTEFGQKLTGRPLRSATSAESVNRRRQNELLAILEPIGSLRVDRIPLPGTDVTLRITRTANLNRLLDVAANDPKQDHMPYWAEIWPSGVVLAGVIARQPGVFHGKRVLELGPGVGVTAVAAMQAGADLIVADYDRGSLAMCALNALDQTGAEPETIFVNWRKPNAEFLAAARDGFSVILAADVLYETKDVKPLVKLVGRILAPEGELWLAHPGRDAAERLVKEFRQRGWRDEREECASPRPDPNYHTWDIVTIHRFRRPEG
ncbi:MAG: class I SAM-dependent methyltransferase [Thermomicrobiales bacterium]